MVDEQIILELRCCLLELVKGFWEILLGVQGSNVVDLALKPSGFEWVNKIVFCSTSKHAYTSALEKLRPLEVPRIWIL